MLPCDHICDLRHYRTFVRFLQSVTDPLSRVSRLGLLAATTENRGPLTQVGKRTGVAEHSGSWAHSSVYLLAQEGMETLGESPSEVVLN